jgi:hypothetical protein
MVTQEKNSRRQNLPTKKRLDWQESKDNITIVVSSNGFSSNYTATSKKKQSFQKFRTECAAELGNSKNDWSMR